MKNPRLYLRQILEAADFILETAHSLQDLQSSKLIRDAVIRNFEVMGEATKRLSPAFRVQHPQIPWRSLAGFRDVLIHDYDEVAIEVVWDVIQNSLPMVRLEVARLLEYGSDLG
ncbi:MAG: DUF86 domain-containing protein [Meiothermus sp.]|uniref:HepT-like ribonuclease domain-containing protein n=1 Tax=Meiothermus sp. TaxID=1955249 RepID=UPI0025E48B81|nr:DUF86 domain-containing protein [Meiothermus sp.]MCS7068936.1 DUF86 domain-containing protein [Meiothermus sp.]MDW8425661.1 DUF86 domain-containing protein [Meiothermus sp.]